MFNFTRLALVKRGQRRANTARKMQVFIKFRKRQDTAVTGNITAVEINIEFSTLRFEKARWEYYILSWRILKVITLVRYCNITP